jgi:hypothetical protein
MESSAAYVSSLQCVQHQGANENEAEAVTGTHEDGQHNRKNPKYEVLWHFNNVIATHV